MKVHATYGKFELEGELVDGGHIGDSSIPHGTQEQKPYIHEFSISIDGEEQNIKYFSEWFLDLCRSHLELQGK